MLNSYHSFKYRNNREKIWDGLLWDIHLSANHSGLGMSHVVRPCDDWNRKGELERQIRLGDTFKGEFQISQQVNLTHVYSNLFTL